MKIEVLIVERGRFIYTKEIELPNVYSNLSAIRYAQKLFPNAILFNLKNDNELTNQTKMD